MPDAEQIEWWKQDAKKRGPGLYGHINQLDQRTEWFRVDSLGRGRHLRSRTTARTHALPFNHRYGYERVVADAHELLLNDLFVYPHWKRWREEMFALAGGLAVPDESCACYECLVEQCQRVEERVTTERPQLAAGLEPMARRHGIDVLPWGKGWLARKFCDKDKVDMETAESHEPKGYPRAQRSPALDSLLLYMYLTGHFNDQQAREIVKPAIDLDHFEYPVRRVQEIKRQMGVSRRAGRPPVRDDEEGTQEVYALLHSQVMYLHDLRVVSERREV